MIPKEFLAEIMQKLNKPQFLSLAYVIPIFYLNISDPLWLDNTFIAAPLFLSSIGLMSSIYIGNRELLHRIFKNTIIKWVATVFIYSICLWFAKLKLSTEYGIPPENLNYSAIAYAFALSFPVGAMVCGIMVYIYIFLREISPAKMILSTLASALIAQHMYTSIKNNSTIEKAMVIVIIITISYKMVTFFSSFIYGNTFSWRRLTSGASLFAISISLIITSLITMKFIEIAQDKFILLDAKISRACNESESGTLYIEKSDTQCYKVSGKKPSQLKLILVDKNNSSNNNNKDPIHD